LGICGASLACAQLSDIDDYSIGPSEDAKADSSARLPYLSGEACEACLVQECNTQQEACAADEFCIEWVDGMRNQPGPVEFYERHQALRDAMWAGMNGYGNRAQATIDLSECSSTRCFRACQLGRDFSCVGEFEWANEDALQSLRISVASSTGPLPATPWTVRACSDIDIECEQALASTTTDARGLATLLLPAPSSSSPGYGFLSFSGPQEFTEWGTIVTRPFANNDYTPWVFTNLTTLKEQFALFDTTFDPNLGYVWVVPADCQGLPAKDVELDVQLATASGPVPCDPCEYTYADDGNAPNPNPKSFSTAGKQAFVSFIPPRLITLRVLDATTKDLVAIQTISIVPGRMYFVRTYPPSTAQLEAVLGSP
jgi:hypothetical protein